MSECHSSGSFIFAKDKMFQIRKENLFEGLKVRKTNELNFGNKQLNIKIGLS